MGERRHHKVDTLEKNKIKKLNQKYFLINAILRVNTMKN